MTSKVKIVLPVLNFVSRPHLLTAGSANKTVQQIWLVIRLLQSACKTAQHIILRTNLFAQSVIAIASNVVENKLQIALSVLRVQV